MVCQLILQATRAFDDGMPQLIAPYSFGRLDFCPAGVALLCQRRKHFGKAERVLVKKEKNMLKIYGSDLSAPANKIRFTANALGLKFEYIKIDLRAGEQQKPEFLKLHPAGKIPVIDDDGFVLFESNAIIRYLAEKINSSLYPKELKTRAVVDQWIEFGSHHAGLAMSKILYNRVFAPLRGLPVDEQSLQDGPKLLDRFLPVIDAQLSKDKFLTGIQYSLADINLLAILDPAEVAAIDLGPYKKIVAWRNGLKKENFYTQCYKEYGEALLAAKK